MNKEPLFVSGCVLLLYSPLYVGLMFINIWYGAGMLLVILWMCAVLLVVEWLTNR